MGQFDQTKQIVVDTCRKLMEKGYLIGTGGNVSVRVSGQNAFAITPSNYDYLKMAPADICILSLDLQTLEGDKKSSIESSMHAAIYENRADAQAVIHTHQVYASAIALTGQSIPAIFDEQARYLGRSVEIVKYGPSGTIFLKRNIVAKLNNHANAYILQNHGALCLGDSPERAISNVELLEKCSLSFLLALCTEKKISKIPLPIREIIFSKLRKDQHLFESK